MIEQRRIRTVMMIDDEELDQVMYQRIIKRSGLIERVLPFIFADEALEYLKRSDREPIDAILLDINMPRMNGFEFLEQATRELGPDIARVIVVMLTTSIDESDYRRAAAYPAVKLYLKKPLTRERLDEVVALVQSD